MNLRPAAWAVVAAAVAVAVLATPARAGSLLLNGQLNATLGGWAPNRTLTVCTASWQPMVTCSNTTDPATWTGHDIELMRAVMEALGIEYGTGYVWRCLGFRDMLADIEAGVNCSMAIAGITINIARQELGFKFSYPYYSSSLAIMVQSSVHHTQGWGFISPFNWTLWLAILITIICLPVCVVLLEFLSLKRRVDADDWVPGLREAALRSVWTLMLFESFQVTALGARILVLCFGFMSLLLVSTYTANLAAFVTVQQIRSQITGIEDLRGKAVGTHQIYMDELRTRYGIAATPLPFNTNDDFYEMARLVKAGTLVAGVGDEPALSHTSATFPNCGLTVLDERLSPFDYGIAFPANTSDVEIDVFSVQLLAEQESGFLEQLRNNFIGAESGGCPSSTQQVDAESSAVSFFDLSGLWVILAAGLALGIIVMVAQRTLRRRSKQRGKRAVPFPNTAHNDNFERAVEGYKGGAAEAEGTEEEGSSDLEAAPPQQQQQRQRPQEQQQQRNGARGGEHPPAAAAAAAPVATSELYRVPTVFTHTTTTTTARRQ